MEFHPTAIPGVFVIDIQPRHDDRGFFARAWCQREFAEHGLCERLVQCDISFNRRRGTLRGMHLQRAPHAQAKVVRCTRGALFDVIVDVRPGSEAFGRHVAVELTAENRRMAFIPEGCAHGFQTVQDETEVFYQMSAFYAPESAFGFRWDDPAIDIRWPVTTPILNDRDRDYPTLAEAMAMSPGRGPLAIRPSPAG